ncbi:hypothetical protein SD80_026790 [Scytonema tolypothrichoides VB-61278]|nr:hypothetical protein SD80_026790 [Scytonema tolypothrichoides VB-61278]
MVNQKLSQFNLAISQSKGIHKLFTTAILLVAIAYPSSFTEASELNENHFNNASEQQSLEPEINPSAKLRASPVGKQPLVIAQRYYRRPRVRQRIIIGPRRYRVRGVRRYRVRPVYRPVRRYRVRPVRRYNRYRGQRVYVR